MRGKGKRRIREEGCEKGKGRCKMIRGEEGECSIRDRMKAVGSV